MKLTIDRSDLLRALSHVQSVVERRNTIPILSNVLLSASSGSLQLTATDLDIEAVDAADAQVDQEGGLTAPAQTLFDVVRKLPETAEVQLEFLPDNQRLSIQAGRSRFALPTLPAADFQTMNKDEGTVSFSIDVADLKRLIDKTRFAISTEETRYYLNGVYLHVAEGEDGAKLRAVATDGHRLALSEIDAPQGCEGLPGVIIPRKAVSEIRRLIDGYDGVIEVSSRPGEGATFEVYLPRTEGPRESGESKDPDIAAEDTPIRSRARVLFVDDDEPIATMGQRMLERFGYEVTAKLDSREAFETFRSQPDRFDVVVTDYYMPHLVGTDLARKLKTIRPDIPLILITSHMVSPEQAREAGFREFLLKPMAARELGRAVRQALTH